MAASMQVFVREVSKIFGKLYRANLSSRSRFKVDGKPLRAESPLGKTIIYLRDKHGLVLTMSSPASFVKERKLEQ